MSTKILKSAAFAAVVALASATAAHAADKAADKAPAVGATIKADKMQGDPVVAKVNGTEIKRSEVLALIAQQPEQVRQMDINELFPKAVDQVVVNKIVMDKAADAKLENDPEVKKDIEQATKQIVAGVYVDRQVKEAMTDKKLHEIYDKAAAQNKGVEEVKARQILVDSEDKAKDVIAKLDKGGDFEKLAKDAGGPSAQNGGELGYFTKDSMPVQGIADAAFALKKGEYTKKPVKTQLGWSVIQVEDRRPRAFPKFEDVKPQLEQVAHNQVMTELLKKWESQAKVQKFDINGDPVKSQ
jgi:peptidyl-prolyl cis-trans isomerase C